MMDVSCATSDDVIADLVPPIDPAALAAEVRILAHLAGRAVNDPETSPWRIFNLVRRLRVLERRLGGRPADALARWLANLRRRLESHPATTPRPACQGTAPIRGE
jgi:hypothetical protein